MEQRESGLLSILLIDQRHWAMEELQREFKGEEIEVDVRSLVAAGLAHRYDDFVFASLAAVRGEELAI